MIDALRPPQPDAETVERVWRAVVARFPEVASGPERDGTLDGRAAMDPMAKVARRNPVAATAGESLAVSPEFVGGSPGEGTSVWIPPQQARRVPVARLSRMSRCSTGLC